MPLLTTKMLESNRLWIIAHLMVIAIAGHFRGVYFALTAQK